MRPVTFGKMRRAGKTAGQRHVDHAQIGLHQQVAGPRQPQLHVIAFRRAVQVTAEKAFELAAKSEFVRSVLPEGILNAYASYDG